MKTLNRGRRAGLTMKNYEILIKAICEFERDNGRHGYIKDVENVIVTASNSFWRSVSSEVSHGGDVRCRITGVNTREFMGYRVLLSADLGALNIDYVIGIRAQK